MKEIIVEKRELSAEEKARQEAYYREKRLHGDSRKCPSDILRQRRSYR